MGNYILFDSTYDYGTSYVFQGTTLYTMGNSGSWAIGANVTTGMSLALDAPVVSVATGTTGIDLSWTAVGGANSYQVFSSADPYAADPWTLLSTTDVAGYNYLGTDASLFFKVVASSEFATTRANDALISAPLNLNLRSIKATQVPKGTLNLKLKK